MALKISEILAWLDERKITYSYFGDEELDVLGFSSLMRYKPNTITWIKDNSKYEEYKHSYKENPICAVVKSGMVTEITNVISTDNPKEAFFSILKKFWGDEVAKGKVGAGTYISEESLICDKVSIGTNCSIIGAVEIGKNTVIENNVVIQGHVSIGENCVIHSGTVIGCDGYGYYFDDDGTIGKVDHFGGVVIGDYVEIGSNTCIDRGTIDDTVIGNNTKIDNLVHIAHNAVIGNNVCVVAGAVICGSVELENGSYVAPGGIVKNQMIVGENSFIGMGAVVTKPVEPEMVVAGIPAKVIRRVEKGDKR